MRQINPEYVKAMSDLINHCPYWNLVSMKILRLAWGVSELTMEVSEKHLQPMGIAHGGVLATIVDSTSFWAAYSQVEEGTGLTTVEMKLNYLGPATPGRITGRGECIRLGSTMALADARILDSEGRLLSYGTTTMLLLPGAEANYHRNLPPKFLSP